ncbi:MAG: protein translocase subunit SecD [Candidatus Krumholzibacteria bacterium]|nr:protein translocase subunit SecD [Candidatus Krumholzibacteria bacterium]MDH4338344.1 protein translocase subunit SecD [Candidatus Krumholzibacteria bacterium]MDH5270760.1 protein translocase subunit SecD [Candidatus Krumholzibacteria bacterium]
MKTRWKLVIILAVMVFCAWALFPSFRYYSMSGEARARMSSEQRDMYLDRALKLGLDLQGGVHLVMEVDDSKLDENAKKDVMDRAIRIYRNRIDQFGVAEPVIQKQGDRRIIVELPGLSDVDRAHRILGQTAQLEFRLVREQDEVSRTLQALDRNLRGVKVTGSVIDTTGIDADTTRTASKTPETQQASAADSLLPTIPGAADNVPLPEATEDRPFTSMLLTYFDGGVVVDERRKETVDLLLQTEQAQRAVPSNSAFLWGAETRPVQGGGNGYMLYLVEKNATLDGSTLTDATTSPDPDNPTQLNVNFRLNRQGAIIFARFTGENIGRHIAIVLDQKVRSAPTVQSKIPSGEGRITGIGSDDEAADLSIVLRAGALPAPVSIVEERTVGPSLGRDSIESGKKAAMAGFVLVIIFMIVYYKLSGALASFAMILAMVMILAVMATLRATLTMPGIAGLILTIGMAVDANVLILERVREELRRGKTVRSAIDAGYDKAFSTILDANVTTLITAFVLWQFGTGPIKGFATTLSVGILSSMFTALIVTHVVYDIITSRRHLERLSV